jgi:hypothetical protein
MNFNLVTGPLSHDMVVLIVREKWPHLVHGVDYLVMHAVDAQGNQMGAPYFARWLTTEVPMPSIEELDATFKAGESNYRAALARHYRDSFLSWSDSLVSVPDDIPQGTTRTNVDAWKAFRQALRDVPQQAGFPMNIEWPDLPA